MMRPALPCLILGLAAGLGCSHPDADVLHALSPMAPEAAKAASGAVALEVMPVRLPASLQRPQLVVETSAGTLSLLEAHRWGNGLDKDIQRVLVENLARLLGTEAVVAFPYGERVKAGQRLEVDVQRLTGKPGGTLTLQATWMVASPQGGPALLLRRTTLQRPVPGPDAQALVAAHDLLLGDLSREIAGALGTLAPK